MDLKPRKRDNGHSIVKVYERPDHIRPQTRTTLICQCGKRFSGWGDRAYYAHRRHASL